MRLLRLGIPFEVVDRQLRLTEDGKLYWKIGDRRGKEAGYGLKLPRAKMPRWRIHICGRVVPRAHLVFCLTRGRWPVMQLDHIDRNCLNDHPANLREVTDCESNRNRSGYSHRKEPLVSGVYYGRTRRTFRARIRVNKKLINIGSFATQELAEQAYQQARRRYFGEFA